MSRSQYKFKLKEKKLKQDENYKIDIKNLRYNENDKRNNKFGPRYHLEKEIESEFKKFTARPTYSKSKPRVFSLSQPRKIETKTKIKKQESLEENIYSNTIDLSKIKLCKTNLKYSYQWDLLQILEKRKEMLSKSEEKPKRLTFYKPKFIEKISQNKRYYNRTIKNSEIVSDYYKSKKNKIFEDVLNEHKHELTPDILKKTKMWISSVRSTTSSTIDMRSVRASDDFISITQSIDSNLVSEKNNTIEDSNRLTYSQRMRLIMNK
jgi:hypothetical protein